MTQSCFFHICEMTKELAEGIAAYVTHDGGSVSIHFVDDAKARVFTATSLYQFLFYQARTAVMMPGGTWFFRFDIV